MAVSIHFFFCSSMKTLYNYSPDRKGEYPQSRLRNFTDTLQADGYAGFD
jgi:hypothetical protein